MRYELRRPADVGPFDDMISAGRAGVIVAIPTTEAEVIANLFAAGLIDGLNPVIEVVDETYGRGR